MAWERVLNDVMCETAAMFGKVQCLARLDVLLLIASLFVCGTDLLLLLSNPHMRRQWTWRRQQWQLSMAAAVLMSVLHYFLSIMSTCRPVVTQVPLKCQVEAISFSAHADYDQTSGFLDILQPPHVVLVHGEAGEMLRLKQVQQEQ